MTRLHLEFFRLTAGHDCIVGEKSYIAYDVVIGDRVKINAFVYICNAVTIEDGDVAAAKFRRYLDLVLFDGR